MAVPTDPSTAVIVCAHCDKRAVARIGIDWLCVDHFLIEFADQAGATHV